MIGVEHPERTFKFRWSVLTSTVMMDQIEEVWQINGFGSDVSEHAPDLVIRGGDAEMTQCFLELGMIQFAILVVVTRQKFGLEALGFVHCERWKSRKWSRAGGHVWQTSFLYHMSMLNVRAEITIAYQGFMIVTKTSCLWPWNESVLPAKSAG
jgi:hypothetical protein